MRVEAPRGYVTGYILEECWCIWPSFLITNAQKQTLFKIQGPLCTESICCNDVIFDVLEPFHMTTIGQISKIWSGCFRESIPLIT